MIRFCPNCKSERSVNELFCEGVIEYQRCDWNLSDEPIIRAGRSPDVSSEPKIEVINHQRCINGHAMEMSDLLCMTCGADPSLSSVSPEVESSPAVEEPIELIESWKVVRQISSIPRARERFVVEQIHTKQQGLLTLYHQGSEPDPSVYEVLQRISLEHIPEIYATGRWNNRAFEVSEILTGGVLSDLGTVASDLASIRKIVDELGQALHSFSEVGLRHRDLQPATLLVRNRDPLDLVISDFGSARLSDFDLDIVSPLEVTRYMAPEAIAGGVAAASDWWSLGIILLEQITDGKCFKDINERAYLIHVLANGVTLPNDLDPSINLLLRGLLARDRHQRWQWSEVKSWLKGEVVVAPPTLIHSSEDPNSPPIKLGDTLYRQPMLFALAAAESHNWEQARDHLVRGVLVTWAQSVGLTEMQLAGLRQIVQHTSLNEDFRLMLALKLLNPEIPLIHRGDIITPGWLLEHPLVGYDLITGQVPELLDYLDTETWLSRLKTRSESVRLRIKNLSIPVNEDSLRINLLSTSRARLAIVWEERRHLFPDTTHYGLLSIIERTTVSEEDLIVLLSADIGQFRSYDMIIEEATEIIQTNKITSSNLELSRTHISLSRLQLFQTLNDYISGFAQCQYPILNEWADRFRVERRVPLVQAVILLSIPASEWSEPPRQQYVSQILDFFEKKISSSVMRGPLVRMTITKTGARVGLSELGTSRVSASAILDHLLQRSAQPIVLDPQAFLPSGTVEARLQNLSRHTALYKRDTGIDGSYLGFPFLLVRDAKASTKTRVAPLLLWPIRLQLELGNRGIVSLSFDNDREEVRVNPALESLLGIEAAKRWRKVADELLGRSALKTAEVMDAFGLLAKPRERELTPFVTPIQELALRTEEITCSAVLFHVTFIGQAIGEDLRLLKNMSATNTGLETALRIKTSTDPISEEVLSQDVEELDRFFTVSSDPSQERSVLQARHAPGLLIEGPPGTGKSQTIVNMVGDAIGRGKSLLIVCQKHAALEVVHKRLVAEGLGNRIVMINDVNKDRNPIIKSIREQVEAIHRRLSDPSVSIRRRRESVATRIQSLESELNRYHSAIYESDAHLGLSYRTLLGELVDLETPLPPIDVSSLRSILKKYSVSQLASVEEEISPLVQYWLPAKFEGSPLEILQIFSADQATLEEFNSAFHSFIDTEIRRQQITISNPGNFKIEDPAPLKSWLNMYADELLNLKEVQRIQLARWLPLFRQPEGRNLLGNIENISREITQYTSSQFNEDHNQIFANMDENELTEIISLASEITQAASWYAFFNPFRIIRKKKLIAFLKSHKLGADKTQIQLIVDSGKLETKLRPLRKALSDVHSKLRLPPIASVDGSQLCQDAKITFKLFNEIADLSEKLAAVPFPELTDDAFMKASKQEIEKIFSDFKAALERYYARQASFNVLNGLSGWVSETWLQSCHSNIVSDQFNTDKTQSILEALPTLKAFQYFRRRAQRLSVEALEIFKVLRTKEELLSVIPENQLDTEIRRILNREARLSWKQLMEQSSPDLEMGQTELNKKVSSLSALDIEMRELNREFLKENFDLSSISRMSEWEDVTRLTGARARRLREFMELGSKLGLMKLRPIWLMNPDVASRVLPLRSAMFDTVVYDEASQMRVEHALPTLYRGRIAIVSGDEKQMPPTTFFASKVESDEAEIFDGEAPEEDANEEERQNFEDTWNRREIKDCPDLLQLAKTNLPNATLEIHYRSAYRELIDFSNACFYGNHLSVPVRHPEKTIKKLKPIEVIRTDSTYHEQTNSGEANKVVEILAKIWEQPWEQRPSIGVVTFNRKQADLIEELLNKRAEVDEIFRQAYTLERDRQEAGEDMGVFVKNVENVQGDERDYIIFSSTFGRNSQGTFRRNFGVLGQKGGERRLNVAVTRARQKIIMVTSMTVADISDILNTQRPLVTPRDYLQGYMEYARLISGGELIGAHNLLKRMMVSRNANNIRFVQKNDGVKNSVVNFIESLGWKVNASNGNDAFGLDLAIENPATGLFAIGVECDAPHHELLSQARAREVWRPNVLKRAVPFIHRVSSHAWYHNSEQERIRLKSAIDAAFAKEV